MTNTPCWARSVWVCVSVTEQQRRSGMKRKTESEQMEKLGRTEEKEEERGAEHEPESWISDNSQIMLNVWLLLMYNKFLPPPYILPHCLFSRSSFPAWLLWDVRFCQFWTLPEPIHFICESDSDSLVLEPYLALESLLCAFGQCFLTVSLFWTSAEVWIKDIGFVDLDLFTRCFVTVCVSEEDCFWDFLSPKRLIFWCACASLTLAALQTPTLEAIQILSVLHLLVRRSGGHRPTLRYQLRNVCSWRHFIAESDPQCEGEKTSTGCFRTVRLSTSFLK